MASPLAGQWVVVQAGMVRFVPELYDRFFETVLLSLRQADILLQKPFVENGFHKDRSKSSVSLSVSVAVTLRPAL